jgi:hypothetical protein
MGIVFIQIAMRDMLAAHGNCLHYRVRPSFELDLLQPGERLMNSLARQSVLVVALATFLVCVTALPARSELIIGGGAARGVGAAATGGIGSYDSTVLLGDYTKAVSSTGLSPAGDVMTTADQSSYVPDTTGPSMSGSGSVTAFAAATGETGFSVLADSFFDIFFTVSVDGLYAFDALVDWTGDAPPYGGVAHVTLTDETNFVDLHKVYTSAFWQGTDSLGAVIPLTAGISYRMTAEAKIDGGWDVLSTTSASADWSFTLTTVPEPTSISLFASGILGLAVAARRRQKLNA